MKKLLIALLFLSLSFTGNSQFSTTGARKIFQEFDSVKVNFTIRAGKVISSSIQIDRLSADTVFSDYIASQLSVLDTIASNYIVYQGIPLDTFIFITRSDTANYALVSGEASHADLADIALVSLGVLDTLTLVDSAKVALFADSAKKVVGIPVGNLWVSDGTGVPINSGKNTVFIIYAGLTASGTGDGSSAANKMTLADALVRYENSLENEVIINVVENGTYDLFNIVQCRKGLLCLPQSPATRDGVIIRGDDRLVLRQGTFDFRVTIDDGLGSPILCAAPCTYMMVGQKAIGAIINNLAGLKISLQEAQSIIQGGVNTAQMVIGNQIDAHDVGLVTTPSVSGWDEDNLFAVLNVEGTPNVLSKWDADDITAESIIYDDGTKVGIGMNDPVEKLEVAGSGVFEDLSDDFGFVRVSAQNTAAIRMYANASPTDEKLFDIRSENGRLSFKLLNDSATAAIYGKTIVLHDNKVGIDNDTPIEKLDVNGKARSETLTTSGDDSHILTTKSYVDSVDAELINYVDGENGGNQFIRFSDDVTANTIFDALSPYIPNDGDAIMVSGGFSRPDNAYTASIIIRNNGTSMTMECTVVQFDLSGSLFDMFFESFVVNDGSATVLEESALSFFIQSHQ